MGHFLTQHQAQCVAAQSWIERVMLRLQGSERAPVAAMRRTWSSWLNSWVSEPVSQCGGPKPLSNLFAVASYFCHLDRLPTRRMSMAGAGLPPLHMCCELAPCSVFKWPQRRLQPPAKLSDEAITCYTGGPDAVLLAALLC